MQKKLFFGLAVCGLLTILLAACGIKDASNGNSGPSVHMSGANFTQTSITIKKGQAINLMDDGGSPHVVANGSWVNSSAPKAMTESGAPVVNLKFNGSDSAPTPPFNTAGTYHLYCTIHSNMNLTVTVQ